MASTQQPIGPWRKSTRSNAANDCVEVAPLSGGGRAVRDSKDLAVPALSVAPSGWQAFIEGVKDGTLG